MAMEASNLVIKVKHGDFLRRFNASVRDDKLDLSMGKLIEKICILFNLASDTELTLTYIDDDGETVTLVDDDDLRDVVEQALNPLRITVTLNKEKNSSPFICPTGSSTPLSSPPVQQKFQNIDSGVSEILKTIPDTLHETLAKLSIDLVSKLSSSAPGITPGTAEIVEYFSKVGLSCLSQISELQARVRPNSQNDVPERRETVIETKDSDLSKVDSTPLKTRSRGGSKKQLLWNNDNSPKLKSVATMVDPTPLLVQSQGGSKKQLPRNNENSSKLKSVVTMKIHEAKVSASEGSMEVSSSEAPGNAVAGSKLNAVARSIEDVNKNLCVSGPILPKSRVVPDNVGKKETANVVGEGYGNEEKVNTANGPHLGPNPTFSGAHDSMKSDSLDGRNKHKFPCDFRNSQHPLVPNHPSFSNFPGSLSSPFHAYECQLYGIPVENISAAQPLPASQAVSFGRNRSQNDVNGTVGEDNDFKRIDLPTIHQHHWPSTGLHDFHAQGHWSLDSQVQRGMEVNPSVSKLDSCFIVDVTMIDGTIIAPSTPFTKIWRMRNNGTLVWPKKTRLVWIGGDKLSNSFSVELQVPASGLAVNQDFDVAVDLISPDLPGRYFSYWRMAAPSGQNFGQRVWVHIQVHATIEETQHGVRGLNLNLPLVNNVLTGPEINNAVMDSLVDDSHPKEVFEPITPLPNIGQDMKFPISSSSMVGSGVTNLAPTANSSILYPVIDQSDMASPVYLPPYVHYPSPPPPVIFPSTSPFLYTQPALPAFYPLQPPPPPPLLYPPPPPVTFPPHPASLYTSPSSPFFYSWPPPAGDTLENTEELQGMEEVEKELLSELEEMGFNQVDLNKEILRFHEYDLQQTVKDLCESAGWESYP